MTAVAAIVRRGDRVLAGQRRADQPHPLKWEFPGGKVEKGEEPRQALARELREELGIRATIGAMVAGYEYSYELKPAITLMFFDVSEFEGEPENRIFERLEWVACADLPRFDFLEGDAAIVELLSGPASAKTPRCDPDSDAS